MIRQKSYLSKGGVLMLLELFLLRLAWTRTEKENEVKYSAGAATKLTDNFCVHDLLKVVDSENNTI